MEMVAVEEIDLIGEPLTPPLSPLALSLHDSFLFSHCSTCFNFLPPNPHHHPSSSSPHLLYCSPHCSSSSSSSTAVNHLHSLTFTYPGDTSDLRTALRLLSYFQQISFIPHNGRIGGLMTNYDNLMCNYRYDGNDEVLLKIKEGGKIMAAARGKCDGVDIGIDIEFDFDLDCVVEEAVLCVVLTNAVEVQDKKGCFVGIAVYDIEFSWINHSCSPNACYSFLYSEGGSSGARMHIAPAAVECGGDHAVLDKCNREFSDGLEDCGGPRVVVRSIKAIEKGAAVTIAYTDLLQPKAMRQSDLWLKYRFTCQCNRCSALPPNYVDRALQAIYVLDQCSSQKILENGDNEELTDYMDDAIAHYLSHGDAESCCEKLENVLTNGLLLNEPSQANESISPTNIRLHPLHHLSLNAYTVLISAYKVRASDLLAKKPETDENHIYNFRMNGISAAYSLLLASLTHHLFLFEPSLVTSIANFWLGAGESLLNLSRSSIWDSFTEPPFSGSELPSPRGYKCSSCTLFDKFEAIFTSTQSRTRTSEFLEISRKFIDCIRSTTPNAWTFLWAVTGTIDFRWWERIGDSGIVLDFRSNLGRCDVKNMIISKCREDQPARANQERISIFDLGVHCLLYGGFLSSICGGQDFYSVRQARDLMYDEST